MGIDKARRKALHQADSQDLSAEEAIKKFDKHLRHEKDQERVSEQLEEEK